ncbi:MAG: RNA methyltransferase [Betaproteobacteria bacterium]|nr:RNA methyltransferase [Betaproteobacteria bacterium]
MKQITSRENAAFRSLRALAHSGRERRRHNRTVVDGAHLVAACLRGGVDICTLAVTERGLQDPEIGALAANSRAETIILSDTLFAEASPVESPAGILAVIAVPASPAPTLRGGSCVVLEGVQDTGNVGSILRSAVAAGIGDAVLTAGCAQAWSPRVLRAAMGAHFCLRVHERADALSLLEGYCGEVVATLLSEADPVFDIDLLGPVAWLFGSEGSGLSGSLARRATRRATIPMPGATESINVAAAAAICLFEEVRQKRALNARDG